MPGRLSIRESLREGLPACCLVGALGVVPLNLERYQWSSATTPLFIWTLIWMVAAFISWKLSVKQGSLMVVANGCVRNVYMLRDLYGLLGVGRCGETVGVADLVGVGVVSGVACGGSYYLATRYCYVSEKGESGDERGGDVEKTLCSPQL